MKRIFFLLVVLIFLVSVSCTTTDSPDQLVTEERLPTTAVATVATSPSEASQLEPTLHATNTPPTTVTAESSPTTSATSSGVAGDTIPLSTPVINSTGSVTAMQETVAEEKIVYSYMDGDDYDIYVMNADGSNPIRLTDSPANELYPIWSPNGEKIAFISEQNDLQEIYVINADGSDLTHLAEGKDPVWSPDGQQLAYVSESNGFGEIYVINVDGSNSIRLTEGFYPSWSPDGQKIAFETGGENPELYVINIDGSGLKHLIDNAGGAVWSPNGNQIAFTSYYDAPPPKVYLINADGSNLTRLANGAGPVWSPDGRRIVFVDIGDVRTKSYSIINTDGTGQTSFISGISNQWNSIPTWAPDGQRIALISGRDGLGIDVINTDTKDLIRLTSDGFYAFPAWSPQQGVYDKSADRVPSDGDTLSLNSSNEEGIILFLSSRDHDPQTEAERRQAAQNRTVELYVMRPDGSSQVRLSDGNREWWNGNASISPYHIPNQVVINGKYVFDLTTGQIVEELTFEFSGLNSPTPLNVRYPFWTSDGQLFFTAGSPSSAIYHLDGLQSEPKKLTDPPDGVWGDAFPALSPDGEWVIFLRNWFDEAQDGIWLMRPDGSQAHRIMEGSANVPRRVSWSPDGSKLVFEGPKPNADTFSFEVWVAGADGSNPQQLTSLHEYIGAWEPKWSPDGSQIVFHGGTGSEGQIYIVDAKGGEPQQLTTIGDANLTPLWLPFSFDDIHISSDSEIASAAAPAPTLKPIAVAPTTTPVTTPDCLTPGVQITSPVPGARFTERYNRIVGTANINRFHQWKIEYATDPNGPWNYLLEHNYPVDNDELIMFDASTVPNGPYGLRLTVVDVTGNYPEPCEVWFVNGY